MKKNQKRGSNTYQVLTKISGDKVMVTVNRIGPDTEIVESEVLILRSLLLGKSIPKQSEITPEITDESEGD